MDEVKEFFDGLAARADASKTAGMNNTYVFDIDGAGTWTVSVQDGNVDVSEGGESADCTITASAEDFMKIVRGEQNRRAEALDLERPARLARQAVPDALRREREEREERGRRDRDERAATANRLPAPAAAPDERERERQENSRVELRREGGAEPGAPERRPPGDERREPAPRPRFRRAVQDPGSHSGGDNRPDRGARAGVRVRERERHGVGQGRGRHRGNVAGRGVHRRRPTPE